MRSILEVGFIFWGLFLVFGLFLVAYVSWMLWVEKGDSEEGEGQ